MNLHMPFPLSSSTSQKKSLSVICLHLKLTSSYHNGAIPLAIPFASMTFECSNLSILQTCVSHFAFPFVFIKNTTLGLNFLTSFIKLQYFPFFQFLYGSMNEISWLREGHVQARLPGLSKIMVCSGRLPLLEYFAFSTFIAHTNLILENCGAFLLTSLFHDQYA